MRKPHIMTGGRYPVLRSVAILSLLCAALAAVGAVISAGWIITQLGDRSIWQRAVLSFTVLGGGFLVVIAILVVAEALELVIDMATSLRMLANRQMPAGEAKPAGDGSANVLDEDSAELALIRGH
jgi:hypothetical protein